MKTTLQLINLAPLLILLITSSAFADIYQYRDDQGKLIIVDNPALIPHHYKPRIIKENPTPATVKPTTAPDTLAIQRQQIFDALSSLENKPTTTSTAVTIIGNQVIVPTTLHVKRRTIKLRLLLDTGASMTMLDRKAIKKLRIKQLRTSKGRLADGSKISFDIGLIHRLQIGPQEITNLSVAVVDRKKSHLRFDGLLGMDVLKHWPHRIDYKNQRIIWE